MSSAANSTTVYGGDEINAIVLDPGSYHTRIGYAGNDFPKVLSPSYYASPADESMEAEENKKPVRRIFGEDINVPRSNYNVHPILKDSVIVDWDAALDQYSYYFKKVLNIEYNEQPILITEPVWAEPKYRQTLVENFYEYYDFPALYLAKTPTCVSFQQGRPNCLVVDVGHDSVSVTPVIDGICLLKNSMRTHYAGQFLSDQIKDLIESKKKENLSVEGIYKIKSKIPTVFPEPAEFTTRNLPDKITKSYDEFQKQKIWHEFKETILEVPERRLTSPNMQQAATLKEFYSSESHQRAFEFPTGQSLNLGYERYQLADSLFDPQVYKFHNEELAKKYPPNGGELLLKSKYDDYRPLKRVRKAESNQSTPPPVESPTKGDKSGKSDVRGLSQLITHTLSTIDIDLRASVAHNIIVTGGVSLIPQLTERLYNELTNTNPGLKIRLHAVGNSTERSNQSWIGGSVLASLGTFHQMWVSKEEYDEAGAERILNSRFR
ncbi:actin-related protein [Scheffersomyces xylosifermentans]|uniref:actin-related protein n=1 Tax=Scheffersomyces xylosifermentans TaxID=1304137 RepID=UPI00315DF0C8